ncbi:PLP-dependent transferase, partial [Bacillus altitudinis]|uniref:PLP-dependent transferase n=1 Tax=Bacillus altitudinis TaxID=293387 RepID=UPI0024BA75FD
YQTSTYKQRYFGENSGYEYSRTGNPTRESLEKLIADIEYGKRGFAFASGLAAITAVLSLFKSGDKLLITNNLYGGTFRVIDKIFSNFGLGYEIIDEFTNIEEKIDKSVKAIYIETPTNPLLDVIDIKIASDKAKKYNLLTIVDNTFMTPYFQNPLNLGADIVIHSATKYLGGHSDLVAGLVVVKDEELGEK